MKKYVIVNYGINGVGGGQIYTKNKAMYMEEKGFEVFVLFCHNDMDIPIKYLKKFKDGHFPEIEFNIACFSKKRIKKIITEILEYINYNEGDEVFIESNAVEVSMWGEELAKRVNGKHIVFSVSEKNKIDSSNLEYVEFKYQRGELSAINKNTFVELYNRSNVVPNCGVKKLTAFLGDPVEEYDAPEIDNLKLKDKNICVFGRMSKPYVIFSCKKLSEYVVRYPETDFSITMLGMKNDNVISQIKGLFADCTNVQTNFVDSLTPVPKKVFSIFDLIIGSSGCASFPYRQGALTLCMDIHNNRALGLMGYDIGKSICENPDAKEFEEYIDEALFTKTYVDRVYTEPDFPSMEECFAEHEEFINESAKTKEYFDFSKCTVSKKEKIKTVLCLIFGVKRVNAILGFLYGIFKR